MAGSSGSEIATPGPPFAQQLWPLCAPTLSAMSEGAYSFSLTTFSPSGKLVQIEYALNAVAAGSTSLGIRGARTRAHAPARARAHCVARV